ncbi:hypothetical protein [Streptacidiphilus sp. EB129]
MANDNVADLKLAKLITRMVASARTRPEVAPAKPAVKPVIGKA